MSITEKCARCKINDATEIIGDAITINFRTPLCHSCYIEWLKFYNDIYSFKKHWGDHSEFTYKDGQGNAGWVKLVTWWLTATEKVMLT